MVNSICYVMKLTYFTTIFSIVLFSCQHHHSKLKTALELAGNNRPELEKVLAHYTQSKDSLKLEAAKFLIENMPGHYTLRGDLIDSFRLVSKHVQNTCFEKKIINTSGIIKMKTQDTVTYLDTKIFDILASHTENIKNISQKQEDIKHISSDFLIKHIDASFKLLQIYPWLSDIPMNIFFEYILPYRFENEFIDTWRDSIHASQTMNDVIAHADNIKHDILKMSQYIEYQKHDLIFNRSFINQFLKIDFTTNCYESYATRLFQFRALGIPAALDYIPFHPNRNGQHYWCTIITSNIQNGNKTLFVNYKAAKIYRLTYSRNNDINFLENEYIPEIFLNPFIKDVTSTYLNTSNIKVKVRKQIPKKPHYCYLGVFNNLSWQPIEIAKFEKDEIEFKNMGKDIVYLPLYYKGNIQYAFNYPFILNSRGEIKYLAPHPKKTQNLTLTRKYPSNELLLKYCKNLNGIIIEASNNSQFKKETRDTILTLNLTNLNYITQNTKKNKSFQFYRIQGNPKKTFDIAEIKFIDEHDHILNGTCKSQFQKAFDNDPLSYASISTEELIIDFGKPVKVSKIICIPRGDGNGIYPGNRYELFYYDIDGWRSLGSQRAIDYFLEFSNVPEGGLLWLRNTTSGTEERPFTIEDGKIHFW